MAKRLLILLIIIFPLFHSCGKPKNNYEFVLPSPDSKIHIYFNLNKGEPYYLIYYKDEIVIGWSLVGLTLNNQVKLTEGLSVEKTESNSVALDESLKVKGGFSMIKNYNESVIFLKRDSPPQEQFALVFRAYNDGISICYFFPENKNEGNVLILSEDTQFDLYGADSSWQVSDAKEPLYTLNDKETEPEMYLPVSFASTQGTMITISETEVTGFPAMKLQKRILSRPSYSLQPQKFRSSDYITIKRNTNTPLRIIIITDNE
jgi:hypothetical protein